MDLIAENGRDALRQTAAHVLAYGDTVSPRGMETREMRHFSVEVINARDTLCTGIRANQSQEVAAAEAIQLCGAFSNPEFAVKHAPNLARFRNQQGTFDGAYGPRVDAVIRDVVRRLAADNDTRQAVVPIWLPEDARRDESLDFPCTLSLGFFVRYNQLELDVTMRSNDVNWGLKNDMLQFTQLQLTVANVLDLDVGVYRHTAMSMHLYARDFEWAENLLRAPVPSHRDPIDDHPQGFGRRGVDDLETTIERARSIARGDKVRRMTSSENWYYETLHE